jgi:hypothetical protein
MPFQKGQSGNPAGKIKGTTNKVSAAQREYLRDYLFANKSKFEKEMENMTGRSYVLTYLALMQYILPLPTKAELKEVPKLEEFIAMTPEERQVAIEEVRESIQTKQAKQTLRGKNIVR